MNLLGLDHFGPNNFVVTPYNFSSPGFEQGWIYCTVQYIMETWNYNSIEPAAAGLHKILSPAFGTERWRDECLTSGREERFATASFKKWQRSYF
jgi:hypothetical protein